MSGNSDMGEIPYEKSNNVETSLFWIQGRITGKDLLLRTVLCAVIWLIFHLAFVFLETPDYNKWVERGGGKIQEGAAQIETRHNMVRNADYYVVPAILFLFLLVQAAKRVHDCNRSSWFVFVPFYNLYLLFAPGSAEDNNYGLLPHRENKSPSYTVKK